MIYLINAPFTLFILKPCIYEYKNNKLILNKFSKLSVSMFVFPSLLLETFQYIVTGKEQVIYM